MCSSEAWNRYDCFLFEGRQPHDKAGQEQQKILEKQTQGPNDGVKPDQIRPEAHIPLLRTNLWTFQLHEPINSFVLETFFFLTLKSSEPRDNNLGHRGPN